MTWCVAAPIVFSQGIWGETEIIRSKNHTFAGWWFQIFYHYHSYLGKIPILTSIFFKWVETNHQPHICHFWSVGIPAHRWYLFRVLENQVPSYIPPGVFPLSSGCQDPVGSEILGPERWPMQPGVTLVGGFPRWLGEKRVVATFEGLKFRSLRVSCAENRTSHGKMMVGKMIHFLFRNGPISGDISRVPSVESATRTCPNKRPPVWGRSAASVLPVRKSLIQIWIGLRCPGDPGGFSEVGRFCRGKIEGAMFLLSRFSWAYKSSQIV